MARVVPRDTRRCVLIVPARGMARWQRDSVRRLEDSYGVLVDGVITAREKTQAWAPARLLTVATLPRLARRVAFADHFKAISQRVVDVSPGTHRLVMAQTDIDWIAALEPDFLLAFAALPDSSLPTLAPLGTWAFAIGTPPLLNESVPAVREIGRRRRRLGLALQRIASASEPAITLASGHTPVLPYSRKRSLARLYEIAPDLLATAVCDLRAGRARTASDTAQMAPALQVVDWIRFLAAIMWESVVRWTIKLLYKQQWQIGLIEGDALLPSKQAIDSAHWQPNPRGVFRADPCFMPDDAQRVLVEEYPHATGRGRITALKHGPDRRLTHSHYVLDSKDHLSFPRAYHYQGQPWLVPEMAATGVQLAYALDHDARLIQQAPVTIEGLHGIDPVLFKHAGVHWALLSPAGRRANYQLDLFYADDFFGPYHAHPANPIRIDACGGRNAGPVVNRNGRLYRFGQVSGRHYGTAIAVFEITTLNLHEYAETNIGRITAAGGENHGVHSIDFADGMTVIDRFSMVLRWRG